MKKHHLFRETRELSRSIPFGYEQPSTFSEKVSLSKKTLTNHHLYLKENSNIIIKLLSQKHGQLHIKAYNFIYEMWGKEGIDLYFQWFVNKYGLGVL